jgi:hypothetical protein
MYFGLAESILLQIQRARSQASVACENARSNHQKRSVSSRPPNFFSACIRNRASLTCRIVGTWPGKLEVVYEAGTFA